VTNLSRESAFAKAYKDLSRHEPTLAELVRMVSEGGVMHAVAVFGADDEDTDLSCSVALMNGYSVTTVVVAAVMMLNQAHELLGNLRKSDLDPGNALEYRRMQNVVHNSAVALEHEFEVTAGTREHDVIDRSAH